MGACLNISTFALFCWTLLFFLRFLNTIYRYFCYCCCFITFHPSLPVYLPSRLFVHLLVDALCFAPPFTPLPFTINCLWLFLFVISFSSVCCFGSQHLCRAFLSSSSASGSNGCTVFRLVERPLSCRVHHRHHHYKLFPTILSFSFRKFSR